MNNFPAMTEAQRQELIRHNRAKVNAITPQFLKESTPGVKKHLQREIDSAKIAIAALTAEKRLTVSVVQKNERLKGFNFEGYDSLPAGEHEFYTAPSAPVLKPIVLPGKGGVEATSDKSIRDWSDGWAAYREEAIKAIRAAGYEVKE